MPQGRPNSYAGGGFIKSMREKHEPHMKLAGRVDRLEKDLPIALAGIHKTSSKSFGLQRKTLMRVIDLEKKVSGITIIIEKIEEGLEDAAADAVKKPPRKKRPRKKKPPKKSAKKPTPKDWGEEVPGDWDATSGSEDTIPEDEIGGAIDGIDDSVDDGKDDIGGADVIDVPAGTSDTTSTSVSTVEEIKEVKEETKKIHSTISTLTSHTRTNLSKVLGVEKRVSSNEKKITLIKNILKSQQSDLAEKLKSLEPVASPLEMSIQSIVDSIRSIHDTLIRQQDLDKGQEDDADIDAEQDKRDAKESSREGGGIGEGLKKTGEKMLAPVKKGFDSIKEWLIKFFAAKAIMMFMNWFSDPANAKKVSSLFRFIKDWWPAILTGLLLFAGSMLGPTGIIIGITALVVGFIPKIVNSIKSLFGFTKETNKEAAKGEKEAAKAEALADKQDKKDESEDLKPEDDVGDAPEPGTQQTPGVPENPEKFNKGGQVPGQGDKDTVPAMLTPGEFVMSKGAVEQYGIDTLEGMNAAAGGTNQPTPVESSGVPAKKSGYSGGGLAMPQVPLVNGYKGGGQVKKGTYETADKSHFGTTGYRMGQVRPDMYVYSNEKFISSYKTQGGRVIENKEDYKEIGGSIAVEDLMTHQKELMGKINKVPGYEQTNIIDVMERINDRGRLVDMPDEVLYPILNSSAAHKATEEKMDAAIKLDMKTGLAFANPNKVMADIKAANDARAAQISPNQSGTSTPGAPTPPTTTVAYQQAQSAAQGASGGTSTASPGGKVPQFSAAAKLSPHKVKVLGISR